MISCTAICIALAALLACSREQAASDGQLAEPGPPNILLIIADDQAWTDFGFMGHEHVRTPNIDQLARDGLQYRRGYVPHSVCRPSLASLATGLYPHQHGIATNWPPGFEDEPGLSAGERAERDERYSVQLERAPLLAALLGERGYRTLQAGKWWEGDYLRGGFSAGTPGRDEAFAIGRETLQPIYDFIDESRAAGDPFFVWYSPLLPHGPHDPPERLLGRYRGLVPDPIARYWAMCERMDETVGELVDFLEKRDLSRETLIVFLVDNGWLTRGKNPNPVRSKLSPYDSGVRTPILLSWPGRVTARSDADTPVSSIDLAPTLLRAAGIEAPKEMAGVDLLDPHLAKARDRVFGAIFTRTARAANDPAASLRFRYVVEGPWKLIEPHPALEPDAAPQLYHLGLDPGETTDMAAVQPARAAALRARLDAWWLPALR